MDPKKDINDPKYHTNCYHQRERWIGLNILRMDGNPITADKVKKISPLAIDAALRGLEHNGIVYSYDKDYSHNGKNAKDLLVQNLQDALNAAEEATRLSNGRSDEHAEGHALRIEKYKALIEDLNADKI